MTQHNIALAIDALKDLLGDRLSTGVVHPGNPRQG